MDFVTDYKGRNDVNEGLRINQVYKDDTYFIIKYDGKWQLKMKLWMD